jgi:hypothetical protein
MWHVGAAIGTLAGVGIEYLVWCNQDPVTGQTSDRCWEVLIEPEHAPLAFAGAFVGGILGLVVQSREDK